MRIQTIPAALRALTALGGNPAHGEARWPQFRGPDGRGVAREEMRLPVHFGPRTNVVWKTALPPGHSSPCVWDDRIFLTALADGKLQTRCVDRRDGRELWRRIAPAKKIEKAHIISSPAAPTPATNGRNLTCISALMVCSVTTLTETNGGKPCSRVG